MRPFIWTTGNQDIANIESVFGKPTVCGVFEGITYVSGSTINGEGQHKRIIRVIPDSASYKAGTRPKPPYRNSVDADIEEILLEVTNGYTDVNIDTKLDISENKRYLVYRNTGKPFLFLSQTLWSFPWKEFKGAHECTITLLLFMFIFYLVGLVLITMVTA